MPVTEVLAFADAAGWEAWLADHHTRPDGVWLRIAKKGSGLASVTVAEALDVALCYGWIDGQRKALDERRYLQKFTPRRPPSARRPWRPRLRPCPGPASARPRSGHRPWPRSPWTRCSAAAEG